MSTLAHQETHSTLKLDLAGEKYETLIDVLLDRVSTPLQKLFHRSQKISLWYSAIVISFLILAIGAFVSVILGELDDISDQVVRILVSGIFLAFISLIIFKLYIDYIRAKLSNNIVDAILRDENLAELQNWLALFCNVKLHFLFCLIYGLGLGIYTVRQLSSLNDAFIGYGPTVIACLIVFIWGIPMYFLFVFLALPIRLSRFDYQLYKADPRNSEIIAHLSSLFVGSVYLYAIVAMGSTFYLTKSNLFSSTLIISILVAWLPITVLFFISQYALKKIITRRKWMTLKEIQNRIDEIQAKENLAEKETMEKVNRLMDYYDRVLQSKNSALDIRSGLDFLNSLLLPVIGSVLGNLDGLWAMIRNVIK